VCSACGKPDPSYVRKTGLCYQCAQSLGDFCRSCGKEAAAQVRKNKGFCDACVASGHNKKMGRHRRSTGYQGKKNDGRVTKPIASGLAAPKKPGFSSSSERPIIGIGRGKPVAPSPKVYKQTGISKPGLQGVSTEGKRKFTNKNSQANHTPAAKFGSKGPTVFEKSPLKKRGRKPVVRQGKSAITDNYRNPESRGRFRVENPQRTKNVNHRLG
ncbi:MAG TPA: hypothetical protein DDW65_19935, partial [Firmicutes bacterium]|nr:hypothetical protein [Bacillota bacterium]